MKQAAFYMLASVIAFQLCIITGALAGCFLVYPRNPTGDPGDVRCNGERIGELMSTIVLQSFALDAAEK